MAVSSFRRVSTSLLLICSVYFHQVLAEANDFPDEKKTSYHQLLINTSRVVTTIDDDSFLCATLDWWPSTKCNYGQCPWGQAGLLNLDLENRLLRETLIELHPFTIRAGGTLQNRVNYKIGELIPSEGCYPFVYNESALYNFTGGCLDLKRWDELNAFFKETRVSVVFGLNPLYGRSKEKAQYNVTGPWNPRNSYDFIRYTRDKGYPVTAWELGNELLGFAIEKRIFPKQYAEDVKKLEIIVDELYRGFPRKPLVIAPDSLYSPSDQELPAFLQAAGTRTVDVVTTHVYNLGAGSTESNKLIENILSPLYANNATAAYKSLQRVLQDHPETVAWIGEAGGAFNSGHRGVTDVYIMAFWYLDQLGTASLYNNKVFCRQSFIGGNYGLLDRTTFQPNPDYYGALLWRKLMGKGVFAVDVGATNDIRAYAHCQRENKGGVTLLVLNYSNTTDYKLDVLFRVSSGDRDTKSSRLEYHMSPANGNITSQVVVLNGQPLLITSSGKVPKLSPVNGDPSSPITLKSLTYAYVVFPNVHVPACAA